MATLREKLNQEVRILLAVFLSGVGVVLWMNRNVTEPIQEIRSDVRLLATDAERDREMQDELKQKMQRFDEKMADFLARIVALEHR